MKTVTEIFEKINEMRNQAIEEWKEVKEASGVNCCAACTESGIVSAMNDLEFWIKDE